MCSKYLTYITCLFVLSVIEIVASDQNDNSQLTTEDVSNNDDKESKRLLAYQKLECKDTNCTITDIYNLNNTIKIIRQGLTTDLEMHIAIKAKSSVRVELRVPSLDYNLVHTTKPRTDNNYTAYFLIPYVELYFKDFDVNNRSYLGLMSIGEEGEEPHRVYKETVRDFLEKPLQLDFHSSNPFTLFYDCPKPVQ